MTYATPWRPCDLEPTAFHQPRAFFEMRPYASKWFRLQPAYGRMQVAAACMQGFSGTADLMALFPVLTNPRWRPPPSWKNFKWPYLRNRSSDPFHVWLYGGVFEDGGSNGAIFDSNKFKMAAAAILDNFEYPYLRNGSRSTYIARTARSTLR